MKKFMFLFLALLLNLQTAHALGVYISYESSSSYTRYNTTWVRVNDNAGVIGGFLLQVAGLMSTTAGLPFTGLVFIASNDKEIRVKVDCDNLNLKNDRSLVKDAETAAGEEQFLEIITQNCPNNQEEELPEESDTIEIL